MKKIIQDNEHKRAKRKEEERREKENDKLVMEKYTKMLAKQDEERNIYIKDCEQKVKQILDKKLIVEDEKEKKISLLEQKGLEYKALQDKM